MGALLQFPSDERSSPKHADQGGQGERQWDKETEVGVGVLEPTRQFAAVSGRCGEASGDPRVAERRRHARPRGEEERRQQGQESRSAKQLKAVLPPGEPDHRETSVRIAASCGAGRAVASG